MISIVSSLLSFIVDLKSKQHIKDNFIIGESKDIQKGNFTIKHTKNKGLMLGKFKDKTKVVKGMNLLGALSLLVIIFISISKKMSIVTQIGLGLLMGGGAGNLYDRLKYGEVTDFLIYKRMPKIIFNLADVFIVFGAFIVFVAELIKEMAK